MPAKPHPVVHPQPPADVPRFWRDPRLPFIEARSIRDGRTVGYGRHSHETFSIGAVTGGRSTYLHGRTQDKIGAGAVVVMNPGDVHACNPDGDTPWSYQMLYVDAGWLARLQHELGGGESREFAPFSTKVTDDAQLYAGLMRLHATLTDTGAEHLEKQGAAIDFFSTVQQKLDSARLRIEDNRKLVRAADYIADNFMHALRLEDICAAAELSAPYLIRAFRQRYGMTPHEYLVNRRIQHSRAQLKRGRAIAEVALESGFADQAHFQRAFKRFVAATPGQYRGAAVHASNR